MGQINVVTQQVSPIEKVIQVEESKSSIKNAHEIKAHTLSSLNKERELLKNTQFQSHAKTQYEVRPFNETEMLLLWNKYAQKMEEQGNLILNSILTMSEPKLSDSYVINYELPNESTRYELEKNKTNLLGYLRGMLHNHDIQINVNVSEGAVTKRFYTPDEKYNHFKTLNADIELLRKTFGLDF